jgi:phage tail sheath gpL-like
VRATFVSVTGMTVALNGGSAGTTVAGKFGAGTATAGTLAEDITNALAAAATQEYDVIAIAADDTTNWTRLRTHLNTYAGITERKRQRGVVATVKDLASAITDSATQNATLLQIVWHYLADDSTGRIAAQVAAGRIWGDGQVGGGIGKRKGVQAYAAANVAGTMLASIREQVAVADQPLRTEQQAALDAGLTPLAPSPANPGYTQIVRSVTNRHKDANGNPDYKVLDTTKVDVMFFCAKSDEAFFASEYAAKNIAPDPTNGDPPRHEDVVYPSMVKADWITLMYEHRDNGLLTNVETLIAGLQVEIDASNPALVLGYAPYDVIENFHILAGVIAQVG